MKSHFQGSLFILFFCSFIRFAFCENLLVPELQQVPDGDAVPDDEK